MQSLFKVRIKTGDTVMVRSGKHKGKTGKVLAVHPKTNKVTVEGVNIVKKHRKPTQAQPQGGIIELTKPIWISKVGLLDSTAKKPSRVGYKTDPKGNKIRVLKTSGKEVK
jgi:large subunit ribosomal protein L24